MTNMIRCISPVDGRVYAERPALSPEAADAAVVQARAAQKAWAARPLDERRRLVLAGIAALNERKGPIVEELAWQMGRPTSNYTDGKTFLRGNLVGIGVQFVL